MADTIGCNTGYTIYSLINGTSFNDDRLHRKLKTLTWLLQRTAGRCGSAVSDPTSSQSQFRNDPYVPLALYFTIQTTPTPTSSSVLPVTSSNCNGHDSACKNFVSSRSCTTAASRYDSDAIYSQYTSHWFNSEDQEGCTAIFQCSSGYPAGGVSGADIQKYFAEIYTSVADGGAGCGICGSVYVNNGTNVCEFTFNECGFSTCQTCNGNVCTHP